MGRAPCCEKVGLKKGRWTEEEDEILRKYIQANGEGSWRSLPKNAGLLRCGKSCRLRWVNYLKADLKRGDISAEEEDIIIKLHSSLGNRWSIISGHLPGRTDNDLRNYWRCHLSKKIHSSSKPNSNVLPSVIDFAKNIGGGCKRKGSFTNELAMKKNCNSNPSIVKMRIEKPEEGGSESCVIRPNLERVTLKGNINGKVGEREIIILDPCVEGKDRENLVISAHYEDIGEGMLGFNEKIPSQGESGSVVFSTSEERETGILGSHFGQDSRVLCPCDNMNSGLVSTNNGISSFIEELENWIMGPNGEGENGVMSSNKGTYEEREKDGLSSNGENCELYPSFSMTSCFDDAWIDWNWEGDNLWEEGTEEILTWLWESEVGEGRR